MPFKSERQKRFMYAKHPEIAKRWTSEYGASPVGQGGNDVPLGNKQTFNRMLKSMGPGGPRPKKPPKFNYTNPPPSAAGPRPRSPRSFASNMEVGKMPPGPRDPNIPNRPLPDEDNPGGPRPGPVSPTQPRGRMRALTDKNKSNDWKSLIPLIRMMNRAKEGKQFGGHVFGENMGNTMKDFRGAVSPYTKGTGLMKYLTGGGPRPSEEPRPRDKMRNRRNIPRY